MFTFQTTVSYSKVDRNGRVPLYEILNYFQDCTNFHSESVGAGIDFMESVSRAWILVAYKVRIKKQLKLGQDISVGTAPTKFRGMFASRNFLITDAQGEVLVEADSLWILMDMENRTVTRITERDCQMYTEEEPLPGITANRKVKLLGTPKACTPFRVLKTYIDNNGHMNNADYLRAAQEFLPADMTWRELDIVYNKEAMEGEEMIPSLYEETDGVGICFENTAGELLATIKLTS